MMSLSHGSEASHAGEMEGTWAVKQAVWDRGTIPKPGLSDPASWLSPLVITEGLEKNREVLSIKSLSASTPRGGQWHGTGACHSTYTGPGLFPGVAAAKGPAPAQQLRVPGWPFIIV